MHEAHRIICREHRNLLALLSCLKALVRDAEAAERQLDLKLIGEMLDYLETFLNRFHHPKETSHLFPALRRRDDESAGLLADLQAQHEQVEELHAQLRTRLLACEVEGPSMLPALREAVETYTRFELRHMTREETELLPAAERCLREEDWEEIDAVFRANDDPLFGENSRHEYAKLFSEIAARNPASHGFGRPAED